mmetsp:Transcript_11292/g.25937  ORF Transcript_11292/g.25937 Transcript_11292/m.25937 type:complete len:280 (+) Transcript_11292:58-897(+)
MAAPPSSFADSLGDVSVPDPRLQPLQETTAITCRWLSVSICLLEQVVTTGILGLIIFTPVALDNWLPWSFLLGIASCVVRLHDTPLPRVFVEPILTVHAVEMSLLFLLLAVWMPEKRPDDSSELLLNCMAAMCILCGDALVIVSAFRQDRRNHPDLPLPHGVMLTTVPLHLKGAEGAAEEPRIERLAYSEKASRQAPGESGCTAPDTCVICLQDFNVGEEISRLPCLHLFHVSCLDTWIRSHDERPWCPFRCDCKRHPPPPQQEQSGPIHSDTILMTIL